MPPFRRFFSFLFLCCLFPALPWRVWPSRTMHSLMSTFIWLEKAVGRSCRAACPGRWSSHSPSPAPSPPRQTNLECLSLLSTFWAGSSAPPRLRQLGVSFDRVPTPQRKRRTP